MREPPRTNDKPDRVTRETVVPAPIERTWEAVSDEDGLRAWLADDLALELCPGGELEMALPDGTTRIGFVEEVDEPRRLSIYWRQPGEELTRVELDLTEVDGGTLVRVTETQAPISVEAIGIELQRAPTDRSSSPEMHAALIGA